MTQKAFVTAQTEVAAAPLVPEIRLHLASDVTPLWQATEAALARDGLPPPFWAFAWPGGQALARWLLDNPARVRGRTVLDFAAGGGIAAIAAAQAGAALVAASEVDPFAVAAIGLNAALNGVVVESLAEDLTAVDSGGWEVILAGDICYERAMADTVLRWLRAHARAGATVLFADPGRSYAPSEGLNPLATYRVPTSVALEDREMRDTVVSELMAV